MRAQVERLKRRGSILDVVMGQSKDLNKRITATDRERIVRPSPLHPTWSIHFNEQGISISVKELERFFEMEKLKDFIKGFRQYRWGARIDLKNGEEKINAERFTIGIADQK